jgi:DNA-binding transcriptional ArsR family regulator
VVDRLSLVARLVANAELQAIDDEALVLADGSLTRLTGTAALVLGASDGVRTLREVADAIGLSPREVMTELDSLADQGLVELREPGPRVRYRKPDHVAACEDGDQIALVDLRDGHHYALSESGAHTWLVLTSTGVLEETVAELEGAHPAATHLADDVARFVDDLVTAGLLERLPRPG